MQPWNKSINLLRKADDFYRKALWSLFNTKTAQSNLDNNPAEAWTMPDDDEPLSGRPNADLISEAENFDFKDEELSNQFESFMNGYEELVDSLSIDPAHLNDETMHNAGELIRTLNIRAERLIKNPYLDMNDKDGWGEDFDPGDFSAFVLKVLEDSENQLKTVAGQDIDINEMQAAQYAQEFNDIRIDKGDQNIRWTGDKIKQMLEARKRYFERLMEAKKVGPAHPRFEMYQNYIANRKNQYQNIISNPEKKAEYRQKSNERHGKYRAFDERRQELVQQIARTRDKDDLEKLNKQLAKLNLVEQNYKQRTVKQVVTNREEKSSGGFKGLLIHLHQKTESYKSDTSKKIKAHLKKSPELVPYKKALEAAVVLAQSNPTPINQAKVKEAEQAEAAFSTNYLNNHPAVMKARQEAAILKDIYGKMKSAYDAGWIETQSVPEELQPVLYQLVVDGETVLGQNIGTTPINNVIAEMLRQIKSKLQ